MDLDMNDIAVWWYKTYQSNLIRMRELERESVNEIAEKLPEGVYTTLRTYNHDQVLYFDQHIARLEESAKLLGFEIKIDKKDLRLKLRIANKNTSNLNNRIRIHISLSTKTTFETYLIFEALSIPSEGDYLNGVAITTRRTHRNNPAAKATNFLQIADSLRKESPEGINEILMIGDNNTCLEGLSSNFYGVSERAVWTAENGILHGITRKVVLDVILENNIQFLLEGFPFDKLAQLDEAFITSTSRGVLPVTQIDGNLIGTGLPGTVTERIRKAFDQKINTLLEKL